MLSLTSRKRLKRNIVSGAWTHDDKTTDVSLVVNTRIAAPKPWHSHHDNELLSALTVVINRDLTTLYSYLNMLSDENSH
jgi:hypothetical protein